MNPDTIVCVFLCHTYTGRYLRSQEYIWYRTFKSPICSLTVSLRRRRYVDVTTRPHGHNSRHIHCPVRTHKEDKFHWSTSIRNTARSLCALHVIPLFQILRSQSPSKGTKFHPSPFRGALNFPPLGPSPHLPESCSPKTCPGRVGLDDIGRARAKSVQLILKTPMTAPADRFPPSL